LALTNSVNLYPYALNNPLLWTDPFGLAVILQGKAGDWPNPVVVERLGQMSDRLGRDIIITGGKEPRPKNPNSLHPKGNAADIKIPGMTSEEVAEEAVRSGFPGIITYDPGLGGHTHVEVGVPAYSGHNSATIRGPKPPWRIRGESGRSKSGDAAPPLPAQPACGTVC